MEIIIDTHNYSRLLNPTPEARKLLSYSQQTYSRFKRKMQTNTYSLLDDGNMFLTGLVPLVSQTFNIPVTDNRTFPEFEIKIPTLNVTLRDYQIDYLVEALKLRRMIVDAATGSGKSVIIAAIIGSLNLKTLIVVPSKTLQEQLITEIRGFLPNCKLLPYNKKKVGECQVMVGLPRSLTNLTTQELQSYKILIADEAHTCAANQATDVILRMNAPFRYGFTGTVKGRSDNKDLVVQGLLGEVSSLKTPKELMDSGYIANVSANIHYGSWEGEYSVLEDLLIVNNPKRNDLILNITKMHKKETILILVRRVDHGKLLNDMIKGSIFVSGATKDREEIRNDMKRGKYKVLIASNVFATGLDIPNLEIGINAAGGKAETLTGQRIGRLMRPWHDLCKKWYDIYDKYHPTLEEHSQERLRVYQEKGINLDYIHFPYGVKAKVERLLYG